mmetsp:Transcript_53446/g.143000  ORF Transcript_53446/g.143000 Transcript_53446/m.143000 type:complete len:101 (+) Transcript_53446:227-529(+)
MRECKFVPSRPRQGHVSQFQFFLGVQFGLSRQTTEVPRKKNFLGLGQDDAVYFFLVASTNDVFSRSSTLSNAAAAPRQRFVTCFGSIGSCSFLDLSILGF